MWNAAASVICGCLAALPLIGCAGNVGTSAQAPAVTPAAIAEPAPDYAPAPRVYALGSGAPAAVLVLWPGDDSLARDPGLWTVQGFDVVMPPPADIYRLVADQQAALAQLVALAHALVWVVGPSPVIDAASAAPRLGRGGVSGVVMTSVASGTHSCSESFFYSDPGTGGPPKVEVKRSGDCGTGTPALTGRQPSVLPAPSAPWPNQPRLIEASSVGKNLPPAGKVRDLAELIKSTPPG